MSEPIEVVQEFCDLMAKRNPEALRSFVANDATYQNTGMSGATGIEAVLENLAGQFAMFPDSCEYRMQHIVASDDVVMTERLDMIKGADGGLHGVPVMGTFIVRDGKIARWTDYFDTGLVMKILSGEEYRDLVPSTY